MNHISEVSLREMNDFLSDIGDKEGARDSEKIIKAHPTKADINIEEKS